jgi:HSP20 family protein
MNTLVRWQPFRKVDELFNAMTPLWGRFPTMPLELPDKDLEFIPPVDIVELDKEYVVKVMLPEVPREAVKLTVAEGYITVKGERKFFREGKDVKVLNLEGFYGTFERTFTIPENVDVKLIKAEFKDGMLTIHLPKAPVMEAKPVAITIQ